MALLHFGWFLGAGFGVQGWGDPTYGIGYDWRQPPVYQDAARAFEGAGFDLFIIEDGVAVPDTYGGTAEVNLSAARFVPKHDPLPLVPYLLGATSRLGVVPTLSASFYEPFTAARLLSTLQHFAGGRLGFNVVTSGSDLAAQNYGLDKQVEHDLRYDRADEWVEVVRKLWRSWEPDAIVEDAANGVYADFRKVHTIDHVGPYYTVPGPHLTEPSPQRTPFLFNAAASGTGIGFAGKHAEVLFTTGGRQGAPESVRKLRAAAVESGREPGDVKIFGGLGVVVGSTEEEARRLDAELRETQSLESMLVKFSGFWQEDLDRYPLTATVGELLASGEPGPLTRQVLAGADPARTFEELVRGAAKG